jgi:hypothetical protein
MNWYQFKLKSGNFIIVFAKDRDAAKKKFTDVWPGNGHKVVEEGSDRNDMPEGAVEELTA